MYSIIILIAVLLFFILGIMILWIVILQPKGSFSNPKNSATIMERFEMFSKRVKIT